MPLAAVIAEGALASGTPETCPALGSGANGLY